jgi:hypothetical protein
MVSIIEASPHDAGTAYVAIDRHKLDDLSMFTVSEPRKIGL